ncbi:hypothetical protein [Psychrobacter sp. JCM 18901]|uniref:hypothetical protein n=1 Tax=Psychrobacter sp. JCM 18901 TaxID=1298609 RepID=UPI0021C4955D|nr:hypothetical protein [Psychrobacter sp. JCM 18901]
MPTSTTSSPLATESVLSQPPYPINDEPPKSNHPKPSRFKLTYDIVMIIAISIDLLLISIDAILMSNFSSNAANWLTVSDALIWYQTTLHDPLRTAGGFFTIFLVIELLLRWAIAIKQKSLLSLVLFPIRSLVRSIRLLSAATCFTTAASGRYWTTSISAWLSSTAADVDQPNQILH